MFKKLNKFNSIISFIKNIHWAILLLCSGGLVLAPPFVWIYQTFLKDWLATKHSLELSGLVFILVFLAIAVLPILIIMLAKKKLKRKRGSLTDTKDIAGAIEDWFRGRGGDFYTPPFAKEKYISFQDLDDSLDIKKGASRKYLPVLAQRNRYGIEVGKKTFKLVPLTAENSCANLFKEYLPSEKDSKQWSIPTYDIDNRLHWPKGTAKNCIAVWFELEGKYGNIKFKAL